MKESSKIVQIWHLPAEQSKRNGLPQLDYIVDNKTRTKFMKITLFPTPRIPESANKMPKS